MDYDNKNTGVLFKNDKKGNDKAPDYSGSFEDSNGVEKDLAGWIRQTKSGKMMLSIKVSDKWVKPEGANNGEFIPSTSNEPITPVEADAPFNDAIPF